jgi:protoporphyrinogen oxidase
VRRDALKASGWKDHGAIFTLGKALHKGTLQADFPNPANVSPFERALLDAMNDIFAQFLGPQGAIAVQELMESMSGKEMWLLAKNPDMIARLMEGIFGKHLSRAIERMIIRRLARKLTLDSFLADALKKNFAGSLEFLRERSEKNRSPTSETEK